MKKMEYAQLQVRHNQTSDDEAWILYLCADNHHDRQQYKPAKAAFEELGFLGYRLVSVDVPENRLIDWHYFFERETEWD